MAGPPLNGISTSGNSSEAAPNGGDAPTLKAQFNQTSGAQTKPVEYNAEAYKEKYPRKWDKMEKAAEDGNELTAAKKYDGMLRKDAKEYINSDEAKARPDYDQLKKGFTNIKEDPSRQVELHNVNRMVLDSYRDDKYDGKNINQRARMVEREIKNGIGSRYPKDADHDERVGKDIKTLDELKIRDNEKGQDVLATVKALKELRPVQTEEQMQGDGEYVRGIVEEGYNKNHHAVVIPGNEDGSGEVYVDLEGAAGSGDYVKNQIEANPEVSDSPNVFVESEAFENKKFLDVNNETGEVAYKDAESHFYKKNEDGPGVDAGFEVTEELKQKLEEKAKTSTPTPTENAPKTSATNDHLHEAPVGSPTL